MKEYINGIHFLTGYALGCFTSCICAMVGLLVIWIDYKKGNLK